MKTIAIWEGLATLGGGQKVSLDILEALRESFTCVFFLPEEGPLSNELSNLNIKYEIIPLINYNIGLKNSWDMIKTTFYMLKILRKSSDVVRKNNVELIYSNCARTFPWASIIGKYYSIPVIWHSHSLFEDRKSAFVLSKFGKIRSIKKIIFVSNTAREQFPALSDKSCTIYNGIQLSKCKRENNSFDFRKEFGVSENKKIISTISWIMPSKGQKTFIESIPYVLKHNKDVHFLIVGGVRHGYEDYKKELERRIDELKIKGYVTFTGYRNDVANLLNEVYLNTINSIESCPLIIMEASYVKVPTIGAKIGGTPELLNLGKIGLMYEYGNSEELAGKIITLLDNKQLYKALKNNCPKFINKFNIRKFHDEIRNIVDRTLNIQ